MDYRLPDGDGVSATAAICRESPGSAVVMVTASTHDAVVAAAIGAGFVAFVTKDRAASDVVAAVRAASRGEVAFSARVPAHLKASPGRHAGTLISRELEVLQFLADGASTNRIAEQLFLRPSTVRNHVQNVLTEAECPLEVGGGHDGVCEGIVGYPT